MYRTYGNTAQVFFLILITLITTNLLIAIVGHCWEESVLDASAWRHFGRAAFAVLVRQSQAHRAKSCKCFGVSPHPLPFTTEMHRSDDWDLPYISARHPGNHLMA